MLRIFIVYFLFLGVSAYDVPNETCYDAPAYDCTPGDFNLTVNATICRTYATEILGWNEKIVCDGEPFYHCVMAEFLYNKEWKRFECDDYPADSDLQIACLQWKNVEYCEFNTSITAFISIIGIATFFTLIYFVFLANKGNAKKQAREAYAEEVLDNRENGIIEAQTFKPYTDEIRF